MNAMLLYSIFTLSLDLSRFKSTNNKSQLYHTDIHVQVLIAFNDNDNDNENKFIKHKDSL